MERYFIRYPNDEARAVLHYQCNLQLAEAFTLVFRFLKLLCVMHLAGKWKR